MLLLRTYQLSRWVNQTTAYLLYFAPGQERLANLRKIKHIDNIIVRWEKYKPRRQDKAPQCRNCQMYGHSSVNCNIPTHCMVCSEGHKTDDCPKKIPRATIKQLESEGKPVSRQHIRCANCGEQHTASFKGCSLRQVYIDIQKRKNPKAAPAPKTRRQPPPPPDAYPHPPWHMPSQSSPGSGPSWSDIVKQQPEQEQKQQNY